MADQPDFETGLERRLRARASRASRPFDAVAIARQVVAVGGRRRRFAGLEWPSTRLALAWLAVTLLLIYAGNLVSAPPPSVTALWMVAIAGGVIFTGWSWWADEHRDAV